MKFELDLYPGNLLAEGNTLPAAFPSPADVQAAGATPLFIVGSATVSYTGQECALPHVTTLDPVPIVGYDGLLNGFTIVPTRMKLAAEGAAQTVQGIAADGIAQVVFKAPTGAVGDMVTIKLYSNCTDLLTPSTCSPSSSSDDNGGFFTIGTPVSSGDRLESTGSDDPADADTISTFFAYRAPVDFVRSSSDTGLASRTVYVQFSYADASGVSYGSQIVPLTIVRPPVVLIHGIWSNSKTWDYFTPLVTVNPDGTPTADQYDSRFKVYRIDYSANAGDHVSQIEGMLGGAFEQLTNFITKFRTANSVCGADPLPPCIASVQADIVAHSMGGLVARYMVLDSVTGFFTNETFGQGSIHKLITIGTPHNGTPIADQLRLSSVSCQLALNTSGLTIGGAVEDLSPSSDLLSDLNTPSTFHLRGHAIVGLADPTQEEDSSIAFHALTWTVSGVVLTDVCSGLLPLGGYQELYGGPSDLLVPQDSQSFGVSGSAVDIYVDIIHTVSGLYPRGPDELNRMFSLFSLPNSVVNPGVPVIPQRVIDLLNTPINTVSFVPMKP